MIKNCGIRGLIILILFTTVAQVAKCESLFVMGTSQSYYAEPKSLFGGVRARGVGDLVTILFNEEVTVADKLTYSSERSSNTTDNFTGILNTIIPGKMFGNDINKFGGGNTVDNSANSERKIKFNDSVTVQVVQMLPNGNLMVQGKKTLVNANERLDMLVSGVVDPRWINQTGQISSRNVANLQFAMNGKGSAARANNEGIINRAIRYLF